MYFSGEGWGGGGYLCTHTRKPLTTFTSLRNLISFGLLGEQNCILGRFCLLNKESLKSFLKVYYLNSFQKLEFTSKYNYFQEKSFKLIPYCILLPCMLLWFLPLYRKNTGTVNQISLDSGYEAQ